MCNRYSLTKGKETVSALTHALADRTDDLPPMPAILSDQPAPIVRNENGERVLALTRWGMPTPPAMIATSNRDPGVSSISNVKLDHWKRWLGVENRCVVPFTSFSEFNEIAGNVWFALNDERPLSFFAGIWTPQWTSIRNVEEGETTNDLFGLLTTEPNAEVAVVHPKTMPLILRTAEEIEIWLTAPEEDALKLKRPLPDDALKVVAWGAEEDRTDAAAPE
jgi:putative SOS response-associated peptidase YedK